jgi:sporulation protein YlmC with PRC-barrel domain
VRGGTGESSGPPAKDVSPVEFIYEQSVTGGMPDILAENLSGKAVMGSDGTELGMLYNITMNLKTGTLADLVVEPDEQIDPDDVDFPTDEEGNFELPVQRVQAVKDYIVVQR